MHDHQSLYVPRARADDVKPFAPKITLWRVRIVVAGGALPSWANIAACLPCST
jgi:hypothetical protein